MWFKNLIPYRFDGHLAAAISELEQQIANHQFIPCGAQERSRIGWVAPMESSPDQLVLALGHHRVILARKEEKILPASVVKQTMDSYLKHQSREGKEKLRRAELQTMREQIIAELLPRAFSRYQDTRIWLNLTAGILAVDSSGAQRAEEVLALLRDSIGSLPITPLFSPSTIPPTFTRWVRSGVAPEGLTLQEEAELRATRGPPSVIHCKNQPLDSDEISSHLAASKIVTQLALDWQGQIQFLLTEVGTLKRIKYAADLQDLNDEIDEQDVAQRINADFTLATGELTALLDGLLDAIRPSDHSTEISNV